MLIEEEPKNVGEVNPDALEALFEGDIIEEEEIVLFPGEDEEEDEIDLAFRANDEGYW